MSVTIPLRLAARAADSRWSGWLDRLPHQLDELVSEWQLGIDGAAAAGSCSIVLPVRTRSNDAAALKVSWPHEEAENEHLALRHWAGDGAVRLLRADPRRFALLLERADAGTDLHSVPVFEAIETVASLYPRLHRSAPPQLRRLSALSAEWSERLPSLSSHGGLPRRIVERAIALARGFSIDPQTDGTLIHGDLHYGNVLAALPGSDREPWLAIDPKPLSGDPCFEVWPLLRNRWDELPAHGRRDGLLARLYSAVDAAGLDEDRVRDWAFVRAVVDVLWQVDDGTIDDLALDRSVAIAKAVQR